MSETFTKVLIKDDRVGNLTERVSFAVYKGSQNVTAMPYKAVSESTSAQVFNVAVPSLETIISREVLWKSKITLKIRATSRNVDPNGMAPVLRKPTNQFLVNYGVSDALSAFPLHSLVSTMTATINNNTVSMNLADTLPAMLRLVDPEDLSFYNDLTPTCLDYLADYRDGMEVLDYHILAASNANQQNLRPVIMRPGTQLIAPADNAFFGEAPRKFISYPNNVLGFDQSRIAGTGKKHKSRGSYRILGIWALDDRGRKIAPQLTDEEVYVEFEVAEPLLLSPFVFGSTHGKQGFYGIQTMNFQMNMLSHANRAWRAARFIYGTTIYEKTASIENFTDSTLLFQFLTPHASEMLASRNVVPYYELPVYRTTNLPLVNGRGNGEYRMEPSTAVDLGPSTRPTSN